MARLSSAQAREALLRVRFFDKVRSQIGTPYAWGGAQPGGFDCSGLIYWAAGQLGIPMQRVAWDQFHTLPPTNDPHAGDLVYFGIVGQQSNEQGHAAICANHGCSLVINAPNTGDAVEVDPTSMFGPPSGYRKISGTPTGPTVTYPSGPQGPAGPVGPPPSRTPKSNAAAITCGQKGNVFGEGGLPIIHAGAFSFTYCEAKALIGGLLVATGGFIMLFGATILVVTAFGRATGLTPSTTIGAVAGTTPQGAAKRVLSAPRRKLASRPDADDKVAIASEKRDATVGRQVRRERGQSAMRQRSTTEGSSAPLRPRRERAKAPTGDF